MSVRATTIYLLAFLLACVAMATPERAHADDNLLSVSGGLFFPGAYYTDEYDDTGIDLGASFIRVDEYAGLEVGINSYYLGGKEVDTKAIGLEFLIHFMRPEYDFQPYVALGMGLYATSFDGYNTTTKDTGTGFILKTGFRYFLKNERFFIGAYYKVFANHLTFHYMVDDIDLGGQIIGLEIGTWTD